MNSHLNLFKTYTKINRTYQLENDLTRALAICLQEDTLFFHEVLKTIFAGTNFYNELFEDISAERDIQIEIQKQSSKIDDFEHVFAVSLSESEILEFWDQEHNAEYDPVCDLVIKVDQVLIVIEAKRDQINCTAQLYNQILNIYNKREEKQGLLEHKNQISPLDLSWPKLMLVAVKSASFQINTGKPSRFLNDFIELVKGHNFKWLPELSLASLAPTNKRAIYSRIKTAIVQLNNQETKSPKGNRLGFVFSENWADELLFDVDKNNGDLIVSIYPGNTKGQGYSIFHTDPSFSNELIIEERKYKIKKTNHIKFSGQQYITGLWFGDNQLKHNLYTAYNFHNYTGRIKKNDWSKIETLFDDCLDFDWRSQCNWENKVIKSNRSQFNLSFGYEIAIRIPFGYLKSIDYDKNDVTRLSNFLQNVYNTIVSDLIKTN